MCSERELATVLDRAGDMRSWARELVVLVDRPATTPAIRDAFVAVLSRPLEAISLHTAQMPCRRTAQALGAAARCR